VKRRTQSSPIECSSTRVTFQRIPLHASPLHLQLVRSQPRLRQLAVPPSTIGDDQRGPIVGIRFLVCRRWRRCGGHVVARILALGRTQKTQSPQLVHESGGPGGGHDSGRSGR